MSSLTSMGASYRRVSLDSDPLAEDDRERKEMRRIMTDLPTPAHERRGFVRTSNGNVVQPR